MMDKDSGGARIEWRCFHCGEIFVNETCARKHFGPDEGSVTACVIKAGAEQGLVGALRKAEAELADAWHAIHSESTEAAKAYYAQQTRHQEQLRLAEESGYEKGLADGRALATLALPRGVAEIVKQLREAYVQSLGSHQDRKYLTDAADFIEAAIRANGAA